LTGNNFYIINNQFTESDKIYLAVLKEIYNNIVPNWSAVLISCNHLITRLISFTKNPSNQRSILSVHGPSVSANIVANSAFLLPGIVAAHQNTNIIGLKGTLSCLHSRNFLTKYIYFFKLITLFEAKLLFLILL
jgi:hypothetical protein